MQIVEGLSQQSMQFAVEVFDRVEAVAVDRGRDDRLRIAIVLHKTTQVVARQAVVEVEVCIINPDHEIPALHGR